MLFRVLHVVTKIGIKKLLSLFSITSLSFVGVSNINSAISTNIFFSQVKKKLLNKEDENSSSFSLYTNQPINYFDKNSVSNNLDTSYYNNVFLKSLAYNSQTLKLTSTLNNLVNYDLTHHLPKNMLYLDKIDYLNMAQMTTKNNHQTLINNNLLFLNNCFHQQTINFNANGYIPLRSTTLKNYEGQKHQSVITWKKSPNLNLSLNQTKKAFTLNISWRGVSVNANSRMLTNYILPVLNNSAKYINKITNFFQKEKSKTNIQTRYGLGIHPDIWQAQEELTTFERAEFDELVPIQFGPEDIGAVNLSEEGTQMLGRFLNRLQLRMTKYVNVFGEDENADIRAARYIIQSGRAFARRCLYYDGEFEPADLDPIVGSAEAVGEEGELAGAIAENASLDTSLFAEISAAVSAIPVADIILIIVTIAVVVGVSLAIKKALDEARSWSMKIHNFHPGSPWSLNSIRFNKKTRMFRMLSSEQVQFNGHFFKPWIGQEKSKLTVFKPIHALPKRIIRSKQISANLQQHYNLVTGNNQNFNLVFNSATWKQIVASAYLPNPEFSIKQILKMNHIVSNSVYFSDQNWINLIRQVKNVNLDSNYARILHFKNQKLIYDNRNAFNDRTNLRFANNAFLKEMIVGNNNHQDFICTTKQLHFLINALNIIKRKWNDSTIKTKNKQPLVTGIKNSIIYNPHQYPTFISWYYHQVLKNGIWVDSNTHDQTNIKFLTKIYQYFMQKQVPFTWKEFYNTHNSQGIVDLSSNQF